MGIAICLPGTEGYCKILPGTVGTARNCQVLRGTARFNR